MPRAPRCSACNQVGHNRRTCRRVCQACGRPGIVRIGARLYCESCTRVLREPAASALLGKDSA